MHGCSQGFALEDKRFTDLAHCESVSLLTRCVTLDTRNMELEVWKLRTYCHETKERDVSKELASKTSGDGGRRRIFERRFGLRNLNR